MIFLPQGSEISHFLPTRGDGVFALSKNSPGVCKGGGGGGVWSGLELTDTLAFGLFQGYSLGYS